MKLKKVAALCREEKRAILYQEWKRRPDGTKYLGKQFISTGNSAYNAIGIPKLDKEALLRIFDVEEKDFDKWYVSVEDIPETFCFDDIMDGEQRITRFFWPIQQNGDMLRCLGTEENGILFLEEKRVEAAGETGLLDFYERRTAEGESYVAVKNGMMLQAVIWPKNILTEPFMEELREFLFRAEKETLCRNLPKIVFEEEKTDSVEIQKEEDGEQMRL